MCVYVYAGTINRPLRLRTACQLRGEHSANTQRPPTKCPQNIPPGVGADSSRPYPNITKYTYPHYQIRISTLPHTHFPSHFVCVYVYTGTINRTPTAANGLPITWRTLRKHSTSTHEMPNEHSARRRGRFIAPVSLHYQTHTFTSPHTHFPSPLRVCSRICGHDKSAPTAANGLQ